MYIILELTPVFLMLVQNNSWVYLQMYMNDDVHGSLRKLWREHSEWPGLDGTDVGGSERSRERGQGAPAT